MLWQMTVSDRIRKPDHEGFSLVEMLIALLIIAVGLLAMMSMSLMMMRTNLQNDMRNGAVRVTSDLAEELYSLPFAQVVSGSGTRTIKMRGGGDQLYDVEWIVLDQSNDLKQVTVTATYVLPASGGPAVSDSPTPNTSTNTVVLYRHRAM